MINTAEKRLRATEHILHAYRKSRAIRRVPSGFDSLAELSITIRRLEFQLDADSLEADRELKESEAGHISNEELERSGADFYGAESQDKSAISDDLVKELE